MKIYRLKTLLLAGLMVFSLVGNGYSQSNQADAATTEKLAEEAYVYALPILMSYKTMYQYSIAKGPNFKAPFNELKNTARVYGPKDTTVISANSDTPYSLLWMDLRAEPMVLSFPKIDAKRYFVAQTQDLSTYLLPYIGSRATGNDGGTFMVTRGPIYDAMARKETYATSGTRIKVRFFGGYDLSDNLLETKDWVKQAYKKGVPMGADLVPNPSGI